MKKYIVTYHAPLELMQQSQQSTPEEMDEAKELLKGHPHLEWNGACEIEVHETMPVPGS